MAVLCKFSRFLKRSHVLNKNAYSAFNHVRTIRTLAERSQSNNIVKLSVIGASVGVLVGFGYSMVKLNQDKKNYAIVGAQAVLEPLKNKPNVQTSRKIVSPADNTGLDLTLFQYQTCPFCCKVRVFLDYYGLSYDVIEVNPVLRYQMNWSQYKKVPIVLAKANDVYQPLHDSSMIVSVLGSFLADKSKKVDELSKFYPSLAYYDDDGKLKTDYVNKYFLMYQDNLPKGKTMNDVVEERNWRKWADDVLVHTLSPNVYRTLEESYQTFRWFSQVGRWEEYFSGLERGLVVNVGACAMWLIAKRLKKRHHIKEDARESLYDAINHWLNNVKTRGTPFMGGHEPDLSDLSVYGVLKSIEGCQAFEDALAHTELGNWFNAMKEKVETHAGSIHLSR